MGVSKIQGPQHIPKIILGRILYAHPPKGPQIYGSRMIMTTLNARVGRLPVKRQAPRDHSSVELIGSRAKLPNYVRR